MRDADKTKAQLLKELQALRLQLQKLANEAGVHEHDLMLPEMLLETLPDIVYKVDIRGVFTYVNEAVSILGYEPEDLLGRKFDVIVHPDDLKHVSRLKVLPKFKGKKTGPANAPKLFDERRTGDRKTRGLEIRLIHKTDHTFNDEDILTGMLFSYGEVTVSGHFAAQGKDGKQKHLGSVGVIHDVTPWKKTEIQLRKSEQRYRLLVEDMPALICRFLKNGVLTFVNQAYCDYFQTTAEQLIGVSWFTFIPPRKLKAIKKSLNKLNYDHPMQTYEHEVVNPDGSVSWQRWTDRALFDSHKKLVEYQSVGFDITERKRAEQQLIEREEALHEKNLQLQEKNIAIREMMDQIQTEKNRIENRVAENADSLILPLLHRLKDSGQKVTDKHLDILIRNIEQMTAEFAHELAVDLKLSRREIEICHLIKVGQTTKEIADTLHIALKTIENHRTNIRRKLGIKSRRITLHAFLKNM